MKIPVFVGFNVKFFTLPSCLAEVSILLPWEEGRATGKGVNFLNLLKNTFPLRQKALFSTCVYKKEGL